MLYTSQSYPYINFKLCDKNQIETYQYLRYIMLGSPQSELGTEIKLTVSAVQSVKIVMPFWRCLLPATSGRTVTVLPVELGAVGTFDTLVNVYSWLSITSSESEFIRRTADQINCIDQIVKMKFKLTHAAIQCWLILQFTSSQYYTLNEKSPSNMRCQNIKHIYSLIQLLNTIQASKLNCRRVQQENNQSNFKAL